ncbi:MAG: hypothetical protein HZA54_10345 [Planctomycetes bacterium]|nr:hypothetical protein [Planctomycetota bacterium]
MAKSPSHPPSHAHPPARSRAQLQETPEPAPAPAPEMYTAGRLHAAADFETWLGEQVRRTPWWAISLSAHALGLAMLSVITFAHAAIHEDEVKIIVQLPPPRTPKIEIEPLRELVDKAQPNNPLLPADEVDNLTDEPAIHHPDAEIGDRNVEAGGEDENGGMVGQSAAALSDVWGQGDGIDGRQVSAVPGITGICGIGGGGGEGGSKYDNGRKKGLRPIRVPNGPPRKGTTPETENAVLRGLRWLARHQHADGSWDAEGFSAQCKRSICDGKGYRDHNLGLTGLALLAYLGAGYTHLTRETYVDAMTGREMCFGTVVKLGLVHLIRSQDADGCFGARAGGKTMYNHAIAALAMAEAYGLTSSPLFKDAAQRGINFLVAAKNPYKAWRYEPKDGDNDTSVTGWCVMAMKSAEISGLEVSRAAFAEARGYIEELTDANYGKVGYRTREDIGQKVVVQGKNEEYANHEALTSVGMLCRIFISKDAQDGVLDLAANQLCNDLPMWDKAKKTNDYYYWYYGTLAMFQFDGPDSGGSGKYWKRWEPAVREALVDHQATTKDACAEGSWDADDRWGFEGGRVYATAINVLTLEVYYRYESVFRGKNRK